MSAVSGRNGLRFGYIDNLLTVDEILSKSEHDLFVKTSIPGHSPHHLLPHIIVVTYVNVDIHSTCLIMTLSCLKSLIVRSLYHRRRSREDRGIGPPLLGLGDNPPLSLMHW